VLVHRGAAHVSDPGAAGGGVHRLPLPDLPPGSDRL